MLREATGEAGQASSNRAHANGAASAALKSSRAEAAGGDASAALRAGRAKAADGLDPDSLAGSDASCGQSGRQLCCYTPSVRSFSC